MVLEEQWQAVLGNDGNVMPQVCHNVIDGQARILERVGQVRGES